MSGRHRVQDASGVVAAAENGDVLIVAGADVADVHGKAGYAVGCLFIHTDGSAGNALYCNEGTSTVSDFDAVTIA